MATGSTNPRDVARLKRKKRIRRKLEGTEVRPRLTVFRSDKHIYAQIINDETGATLPFQEASSIINGIKYEYKTLGPSTSCVGVKVPFSAHLDLPSYR